MTRRVAGFAGAVIALPVIAFAQATARPPAAAAYVDPVAGMTLEDAIAEALRREPSLRATRAEVGVAQGERLQAALRPNPSVTFMQQNEPGGTDTQTRIEVQWPLDLFRKAGRVQVADQQIRVAEQETANRERELAAAVGLKYGDVAATAREESITADLLAATVQQEALVAARVDAGAATPLDRDMLRVEVQRLQADRVREAGAAERALIALKRLLGLPPDAPLTIRDPLEPLVARQIAVPLSGAPDQAAQRRPDVLEAAARLDLADAAIERAKRNGRFDVSVFGGYMRMDAGFSQRGFDALGSLQRVQGLFHYVSAGAMVSVPVLDRNQGEVAAARAQQLGAAARLESIRLTAESEIASARTRDQHAREALDAYTSSGGRSHARQTLDVVRETYELGRATLFDVLNEQRRYLDVERAYTAALREAYEARQQLREASGEVR
jgi:cobalt-zinc-cadmium efflux system outer membrane protein